MGKEGKRKRENDWGESKGSQNRIIRDVEESPIRVQLGRKEAETLLIIII